MTTRRRFVTFWLKPADFGIWIAYVAMLCIFVPTHEPWADEAQAWLLSRDLSLYSLLFRNLRYEGHPALWYLLLWIPTHLHMSYTLFGWLSAAIASAGTYVLLRFAPFPLYLRALLPFTFFLAYQYAVVARSYVLFPVLAFAIAHVYRMPRARPIWMATLLGLLANVSVHGTIVALAVAGIYGLELKRRHSHGDPLPPARTLRMAFILFASCVALVAVCLWPAADSLPRLSPTLSRIVQRLSVPTPAAYTAGGGMQAPIKIASPPAPIGPPKNQPLRISSGKLANIWTVLKFGFASSLWLVLVFDAMFLAYLFRVRRIALVLPLALLALFLMFVYAAAWHLGLLWVTMIMVLWIAWDTSIPLRAMHLQNAVALFLALLCLLQLPWTFDAFRYDAWNSTSPDKAAAAYLHSLPAGQRMAGYGMAVGVQPYFPRNIFFNQHQTFTYFGHDPTVLTREAVLADKPDIIVADQFNAQFFADNQYRETRKFCGSIYLPGDPPGPICLSVFQRE